jgi:hypothetical protein
MRLSINLRGDLAKLSDAELADRLDAAWSDFDRNSQAANVKLWYSARGLIRHRWAYCLLSVAGFRAPGYLSIGTGPAYGLLDQQHLAICEIRDLMDECERRLETRRRVNSEPPA